MTPRSIKQMAAHWLIELETAPNIEDRWPKFEAWLNENPQHRAAFASMERAWEAVEELKVFHLRAGTMHADPLFKLKPTAPALRPWKYSVALIAMLALIALACALWLVAGGQPCLYGRAIFRRTHPST